MHCGNWERVLRYSSVSWVDFQVFRVRLPRVSHKTHFRIRATYAKCSLLSSTSKNKCLFITERNNKNKENKNQVSAKERLKKKPQVGKYLKEYPNQWHSTVELPAAYEISWSQRVWLPVIGWTDRQICQPYSRTQIEKSLKVPVFPEIHKQSLLSRGEDKQLDWNITGI